MQFEVKPKSQKYLRGIERYKREYPCPVVRNGKPLPAQEIQWASNKHFRFCNDAFERADGACKVEHSMKWRWWLCARIQRESRQLWDYVKRHVSVSFLNRNCLPFNSFSPNISPALWFTILTTSTNSEKHVEYFFITFTIRTSFDVRSVHSAGPVSSQPNENARILFSLETTTWIPRVVRSRFNMNQKFRNGQIYSCRNLLTLRSKVGTSNHRFRSLQISEILLP